MKIFGRPSLKEIYELSKDKTISISNTPFGADLDRGERRIYIKRAVPWKGVKGIENLRKVNPKVADTIEKLKRASQMLTGVKGVVFVYKNGKLTAMPRKSYLMAKAKDPSLEVVGGYTPTERVPIDEFMNRISKIANETGIHMLFGKE